jgi:hypothetical protein
VGQCSTVRAGNYIFFVRKGSRSNQLGTGFFVHHRIVSEFKRVEFVSEYMGSIINVKNSIKEEIKERIVLGTKAYYANLKFFKSRLVTKQSKLKLYRTVIRPIVTYASETWVLKETIIQKFFESLRGKS